MDSILRSMPVNGFRICVDEKNTDITGRVYSPLSLTHMEFSGFNELLLKMDKLFDQVGYPEAFQEKRTFGTGKEGSSTFQGIPEAIQSENDINKEHGLVDTLDVVVLARRNTSWQGKVYDNQNHLISQFKGEMELFSQVLQHRN